MQETATRLPALDVLAELERRGFSLEATTRVEVTDWKVGTMFTTCADKIKVSGPEAPPAELREALRERKPEILAALVVKDPPVPWLRTIVSRYLEGVAHLPMLAANVASFVGLHPAHDGPRLELIIEEVLR